MVIPKLSTPGAAWIIGRPRVLATLLLILSSIIVATMCCAEEPLDELQEGLRFYCQNQLEEARPLFEQAVAQDQDNPDVYAWLAETYRRLGQKDTAMVLAQKAIELDPCHNFAHTVLGDAYLPMYGVWKEADEDLAWQHLLKAVECDPADGNAWRGIWPEAIRRGDLDLQKKALHSFIESEFFAPTILAYNRWMLQHVPENAILLTNGDMDTYPAVALQEVEGFRKDVAIVNYSLLNTTWYARFVRDTYGIPLPVKDDELESLKVYRREGGELVTSACQIMKGWLNKRQAGELENPITVSVTVGDRSFAADTEDHLSFAGAFWTWLPESAALKLDTAMMRVSLASIDPEDFKGPFVSPQDRSSVIISSTNRVADNVTALALEYSEALIESGQTTEALKVLTWAEEFENMTELAPAHTEQIKQLREAASGDIK